MLRAVNSSIWSCQGSRAVSTSYWFSGMFRPEPSVDPCKLPASIVQSSWASAQQPTACQSPWTGQLFALLLGLGSVL